MAEAAPVSFTPQQVRILRLIARNRTNAEIGGELGISERTVESHLRDIRERAGFDAVRSQRWLACLLYDLGRLDGEAA